MMHKRLDCEQIQPNDVRNNVQKLIYTLFLIEMMTKDTIDIYYRYFNLGLVKFIRLELKLYDNIKYSVTIFISLYMP
jgi:hypothetical protein